MKKEAYRFDFEVYETIDELSEKDAFLLSEAQKTTSDAYAPYSKFHVGAVALLANNQLVKGSNQENASYPVGLCAERVLLSAASSQYPNIPVQTIAISYHNHHGQSNTPITPCGICRQSLLEYESRLNHPIRLILGGMKGKIFIIEKAGSLLPMSFTGDDLTGENKAGYSDI